VPIPPWSMFVLIVGLLAACGAPSRAGTAATGQEISSMPALATAHVLKHPITDQVVPRTPTPSPLPPMLLVATRAPASPLTDTPSSPLDTPVVPASTAASSEGGDAAAMLEALLVAAINQVRAANGLSPYQHSPDLSAAARAHSCDLAAHGMISHISSDGRTLAQRLDGASPPWEWPSENIAVGIADPAATVALWMDEPPDGWHRRNILDVEQREVGAGYCYAADDTTGNHHYWTADFSRRGAP
jgi:uncharacterized protein YkwD